MRVALTRSSSRSLVFPNWSKSYGISRERRCKKRSTWKFIGMLMCGSFDREPLAMTEREQVEQRIREVLAADINAMALSDRLFRPDGLFNQLAKDERERRLVAQTPLFQQAQRRL